MTHRKMKARESSLPHPPLPALVQRLCHSGVTLQWALTFRHPPVCKEVQNFTLGWGEGPALVLSKQLFVFRHRKLFAPAAGSCKVRAGANEVKSKKQ